jgi:alkylation response protein AidB-like acyl-CoA dehydrogenase
MNFDLSDEQKMLVDGAARYVRERCSLEARRRAAQEADGFSRQHWARFAEMGWLALPLPEAAGGLGGGAVDIALLMEELGRGLVNEPLVDSPVLCGALLAAAPPSALRDDLLGRIVDGSCIAALAHVEADGRSEFDTAIECRAQRHADGWRLHGGKHRVVHGGSADCWLVTARVDDGDDYALFAVAAGSAGVAVDSYPLIDGTRACDLLLDGVLLPPEALLLPAGAARAPLEVAIDLAMVAFGAAAVGSMEQVMVATADYLKTRVQYGKPLAQFQALQHRMAEMLVETEQARSILYRALAAIEGGDADARRRAASGARVLIARSGLFVTGQGIQLHGGIGTTEEFAVGHHYKALLTFAGRFGDNAFHALRSIDGAGWDTPRGE